MKTSVSVAPALCAWVLLAGASHAATASTETNPELNRARILFKPCAENTTAECGTLEVPVDHRRGHACIDEVFFRYTLDLEPPPDGLGCEAAPMSFGGPAAGLTAALEAEPREAQR